MRSSFIWLFIILIHFVNCINCETISIAVGDRGLNFSPQNITAKVNDVVSISPNELRFLNITDVN